MISETSAAVGLVKFRPFLQRWEGGTSSKQTDAAAGCHAGIHTVKGITWCTYPGLKAQLGEPCFYQGFLNMGDAEWNRLYDLYVSNLRLVDLHKLIEINPLLAYQLVEMGWMGGGGSLEKWMASFQRDWLGVVDSNITKPEIVQNFLVSNKSQEDINVALYWRREKIYKSFKNKEGKNPNLLGWMHRLYDLYDKYASEYVKNRTIFHEGQSYWKP